jgi:hypothetical protein
LSDEGRTVEERLALLEAERSIMHTLHQYTHALDYGHEEELLDCFTDTGVWESRPRATSAGSFPARKFEGRDEIRVWFQRHTHAPELFHKHLVASPRITIDGDTAQVESYQLRIDEHPDGPFIRSFGRYDDVFVRCNDSRWRIDRRLVCSEGYVIGKGAPHHA